LPIRGATGEIVRQGKTEKEEGEEEGGNYQAKVSI
jgi:hypothetical protein